MRWAGPVARMGGGESDAYETSVGEVKEGYRWVGRPRHGDMFFFEYTCFSPVSKLPPLAHTDSFCYHRHHIISPIDSVVKQNS